MSLLVWFVCAVAEYLWWYSLCVLLLNVCVSTFVCAIAECLLVRFVCAVAECLLVRFVYAVAECLC